jgi:GAF domain-containing protein
VTTESHSPQGVLVEQGLVFETLAGFARTMARGYEITDVLHDLTSRVSALLGITGSAVCLLEHDQLAFVASDNAALAELEQLQEHVASGPCFDAVRSGEAVTIQDLELVTGTWPAYVSHAGTIHVRAVAAIPMALDRDALGTVTLYDHQPRVWSKDELELATVLADIATSYVVNASKLDLHRRTAEQLQRALDSRIVIEQAKGIISADRGIDVDTAFQLLRKHANDHHAGLRKTAEAVVKLGLRP